VPTVVPWSNVTALGPVIWLTASAIALEGSAGVEKSFSAFNSAVAGSIHTQSVNVPPVSMAIRNVVLEERKGMMSTPHEYIGGDEDKEYDGDHAVHGEECCVESAEVVRAHQGLLVRKK